MTDIDKETAELMLKLRNKLPGESSRELLTQAVTGIPRKPWKAQAPMPYYKEEYANRLRPVLDQLITEPDKDVVFRFDQFKNVRPTTLRLLIHQSWLWLIRESNDKDKYAELRAQTKICQKNFGIVIKRKVDPHIDFDLLKPEFVSNKGHSKGWRAEVINFIEANEPGKLHKTELMLDKHDMEWLRDQVMYMPQFRVVVTPNEFKLMRLTDEQIEALRSASNDNK